MSSAPGTLAEMVPSGDELHPGVPEIRHRIFIRVFRRPELGALIGTVLVYAIFAFAAAGNNFVTLSGTASWLNQAAELAIVAVPVGLLITAGEFDLSIASVIEMSALTVSIGSGHYGLPALASIGIAFGLACAVG